MNINLTNEKSFLITHSDGQVLSLNLEGLTSTDCRIVFSWGFRKKNQKIVNLNNNDNENVIITSDDSEDESTTNVINITFLGPFFNDLPARSKISVLSGTDEILLGGGELILVDSDTSPSVYSELSTARFENVSLSSGDLNIYTGAGTEEELEKLSSAIDKNSSDILDNTNLIVHNQTAITGLESSIDEINEILEKLKTQIDSIPEVENYDDTEIRNEINRALDLIEDTLTPKIDSLTEDNNELDSRVTNVEELVKNLTTNPDQGVEVTPEEIQAIENEIKTIKESIQNTENNFNYLETTVASLQATTVNSIQNLTGKISDIEQEITTLSSSVQNTNETITNQINDLQSSLNETSKNITENYSTKTELSEQLTSLENKINTKIDELNNSLTPINDNITNITDRVSEIESSLSLLQSDNNNLDERLSELENSDKTIRHYDSINNPYHIVTLAQTPGYGENSKSRFSPYLYRKLKFIHSFEIESISPTRYVTYIDKNDNVYLCENGSEELRQKVKESTHNHLKILTPEGFDYNGVEFLVNPLVYENKTPLYAFYNVANNSEFIFIICTDGSFYYAFTKEQEPDSNAVKVAQWINDIYNSKEDHKRNYNFIEYTRLSKSLIPSLRMLIDDNSIIIKNIGYLLFETGEVSADPSSTHHLRKIDFSYIETADSYEDFVVINRNEMPANLTSEGYVKKKWIEANNLDWWDIKINEPLDYIGIGATELDYTDIRYALFSKLSNYGAGTDENRRSNELTNIFPNVVKLDTNYTFSITNSEEENLEFYLLDVTPVGVLGFNDSGKLYLWPNGTTEDNYIEVINFPGHIKNHNPGRWSYLTNNINDIILDNNYRFDVKTNRVYIHTRGSSDIPQYDRDHVELFGETMYCLKSDNGWKDLSDVNVNPNLGPFYVFQVDTQTYSEMVDDS